MKGDGDDVFADVLGANAEYARTFALGGLEPKARRGLAVLTCIDSRIEPLQMLGLQPGDAKILRNAGARVTDDVIRALVVSAHLLDVDRVMVVAHTKCRMASEDGAVRAAIIEAGGPDTSALEFLACPDQDAALRADVERLSTSPLLAGVAAGGFVYDVDDGTISQVY
ncbi:MAG: carbonic anhydrase [Gaiellaceae bacterium]|nr:carbonic anhydrase [Gaiellaceae bacterium]